MVIFLRVPREEGTRVTKYEKVCLESNIIIRKFVFFFFLDIRSDAFLLIISSGF